MNCKNENRTSLQILHLLIQALLFHKVHKYKSLVNIHQKHNEQVKYCKQKYSGILICQRQRLTISLFDCLTILNNLVLLHIFYQKTIFLPELQPS